MPSSTRHAASVVSRWPNAKRVFGSAEEGLHELHIAARKQMVNLRARLAQVRWALVLKTAALVYLVTFVLGLAASFLLLALLGWWRLDSSRAFQVSFLITAALVLAVTIFGAWWSHS